MLARPFSALVLACVLGLASPARAADTPAFEAVGRAPISGGDRVRARQRALDEAFQHVLEGAVSALLGPEQLTRRAADLRLKILPKAKTYVTSYRVITEGEVEPGIFDVHLSAEVAVDRLTRDLAERPRDAKLPSLPAAGGRVVLCVVTDPGAGALPRLEAALGAMLSAHGLVPVPITACPEDELMRAMKSNGARGALLGEVSGGPPAPIRGTALIGREGKLVLRLVEPDGRRSAEGQGEGAGFGATPALAADDLAMRALGRSGQAIEEVLAKLAGDNAHGLVTVRVVGVRRLTQLATIRGALERIAGVESVEPRRFLPGSPGTIELAVRTALAPRAVAAAAARAGAGYQLHVREEGGVVIIEAPEPAEPSTPPDGQAP